MKTILIISILATVTASAPAAMPSSQQVYDPTDYGAKADGKTLCTAAIQKAIDECSAQGGGTVRLSGGQFLSGTVFMKSKVTLEIAEGGTLLGSKDLKDYPLTRPAYRSYTDNYTERSVIYGEELTDIAIKGKGVFDGQGASFEVTRSFKLRPYGIRLVRCTNVTVEDLKLRNSAMWMQHYLACDGVTIRNISVLSHSNANNDGLDIDSCRKVLVEGCVIDSGDDASTVTIAATGATLNLTSTGTDNVDKLVIGSTQQANGVYGKVGSASPVIGISQITGDGTLTVGTVTPPGFSSWITGTFANGTVAPAQQGQAADPDGDGVSNLLEYAIAGLDPTVPNGTPGTFAGNLLSYSKRLPLDATLSYKIEQSVDLGVTPWAEVPAGVDYVNDGTTISYALPTTLPRNFIRLKVTGP
jgi:polygalacturonase